MFKGNNKMKRLLFGAMLLVSAMVVPIPTQAQRLQPQPQRQPRCSSHDNKHQRRSSSNNDTLGLRVNLTEGRENTESRMA
jgi:hypothetical protein